MTIEKRPFGRTGHLSSAVIFGAAALKACDQATADRVLDLLLEHGVNHIDTAPRYGESELRIGPWMQQHRDRFFLATKTGERDYAGAKADLHRSLDRLRTDRIDLLQMHALIHPDEWERALSPGGAIDALVEAREQGLVRFLGVTGHGWSVAAMHRRSLERFDFDAILLPWNWHCSQNPSYARDFEAVMQLAQKRNVAVQTIKCLARGPWAASQPRSHSTWYEPLVEDPDIATAVHWLIGRPGIFLNSVGDIELTPKLLSAAAAPRTSVPDEAAMRQFQERTGLAAIFGI